LKGAIDAELAQLKWHFGLLFPESVPAFAADALEVGCDGRWLRRIAGMTRPTRVDLERIIDDMFGELGQSPITDTEAAGNRLARRITDQIVSGAISPYDGANVIWTVYLGLGQPKALVPFVGLASEWEDHLHLRRKYDKDIVAAARKFLGR
jgi:hypothetical protein